MLNKLKSIYRNALYNAADNNITVLGHNNVSVLRAVQNQILRKDVATLPNIKSVLNVGSTQDEGDKEGSTYKAYFPTQKYYTLDKNRDHVSDQHLNLDLHDLDSLDLKFDLVLNMSVLEHVENPFTVSTEIQKLINDGGYLFICTPFFYPIHKDVHGRYSDYWRFTDDGLRVLFKNLKEVWVKNVDSVIRAVDDRNMYWENEKTPSGVCALFQKV